MWAVSAKDRGALRRQPRPAPTRGHHGILGREPVIPDSTNGVRTIMALPKGTKALNLGCGDAAITDDEAWINIDNSPGARLAKYPWLKWTLWKGGILTDRQYRVNWHPSVVVADLNKGLNDEDNS